MKKKNLNIILIMLFVISIAVYVIGGSLNPASVPAPTMKTLDEVYQAVNTIGSSSLTYSEKLMMDRLFITQDTTHGPWLRLEIDGNLVEGESTVQSMDRAGTIECLAFSHHLYTPRDLFGVQTSQRVHCPVVILKRVDKSSPLLIKALCNNELVNQAEFRFFRPDPSGSGTEQHYSTVLLENGYISDIQMPYPNLERITFVYRDITWTYEPTGAEHHDTNIPSK